MKNSLRLVALEVTRSCPLNCKHCRAGASNKAFKDELSFKEIFTILENISSFTKPIIIITGGEPLNRKDIFDIAQRGTDLGLTMVMATCGESMTIETVNRLKQCGIKRLSFSIDGSTSDTHDEFRGIQGSFKAIMMAAQLCKNTGLPFQINTTVTKKNMSELDAILKLAIDIGAVSFHPFFLVPTGRAKSLSGFEMNALDYEKTLKRIYDLSKEVSIEIKPTCSPQYHRIAGIKSRGCLAGIGFAFISHTGKIQTCGFLDIECGDLRKEDYNFEKIWMESDVFNKLRDQTNYLGKCGICDYHNACGGCRARAYEKTGNYLTEELNCLYSPVIANKAKQPS